MVTTLRQMESPPPRDWKVCLGDGIDGESGKP